MSRISFHYNLPYEYDPLETEIKISYFYTPGNGKSPLYRGDPDFDAPCIEEVEVKDLNGDVLNDLPDWLMEDLISACWDDIYEKLKDAPKSREDL